MPTLEQFNKICEILNLPFDKLEEAEREVIGKKESGCFNSQEKDRYTIGSSKSLEIDITIPSTDLAKQWQGWGTCLKPAFEPIIVARKPFKGSLVDNVIEYGVGGINIDECRVGTDDTYSYPNGAGGSSFGIGKGIDGTRTTPQESNPLGRFPANTILTYDESDFEEVC
jgi:site-specific DNA-methyltransferase (adenine-specific)